MNIGDPRAGKSLLQALRLCIISRALIVGLASFVIPLNFSSGDLIADRRADFAEMLFAEGDESAAADLMRDALALAPDWSAGHFRLGEMLEAAGRIAEAVECWRAVLRLDPEDRFGATLKLALAGAMSGIDIVPSTFVQTLFDQYAPEFDAALVERLAYSVPERLLAAVLATGRESFAHVLDIGCGTGLMGERMRAAASFLEGMDISPEMLKRAEAKRIYDRLTVCDLQTVAELPKGADLVTAADVFMYIGALDRVFAMVSSALPPEGLFAFSVERHEGPEALMLQPSRRYAHSEACVTATLTACGFELLSLERAMIRMDRGEPIEGLIVVARRSAVHSATVIEPPKPAEEELPVPN